MEDGVGTSSISSPSAFPSPGALCSAGALPGSDFSGWISMSLVLPVGLHKAWWAVLGAEG